LVAELDSRASVTKRRSTKVQSTRASIPFTRVPSHHFLKNRVYLGKGAITAAKWFDGGTKHRGSYAFERVQRLIATKSRPKSNAIKSGDCSWVIYADRGNS